MAASMQTWRQINAQLTHTAACWAQERNPAGDEPDINRSNISRQIKAGEAAAPGSRAT
jgi:hypothetical protein